MQNGKNKNSGEEEQNPPIKKRKRTPEECVHVSMMTEFAVEKREYFSAIEQHKHWSAKDQKTEDTPEVPSASQSSQIATEWMDELGKFFEHISPLPVEPKGVGVGDSIEQSHTNRENN
eukprot:Trichotokara_eunicae@DN7934_c0_g1_i1.p1